MEARPPQTRPPRFWVALQPSIVRIYKIAGLVCLTAILVGLIGFLTVNIFYFFDKTWVRPVILTPDNQKVIEASNTLADAKQRASELAIEKVDIDSKLKEIDRAVKSDETFIAQAAAQAAEPKSPEQWLLRREVDKATLDRDNAVGRRIPLEKRLSSLQARVDEQDKIVTRLGQSPYLKAAEHQVVLAFVPYKNLEDIKVGTKLYSCSWGLIACSNVGKVTAILPGEVSDKHPHDDSVQRGQFVEIDVPFTAGGKAVLFAGGKPLWLF